MPSIRSLPPAGSPERRYALLGGLVAAPFTAMSYWGSGTEVSLGAVFWGGLLAGYLVKRRGGTGTAVGFDAGVVGATPGLWLLVEEFVLGRPLTDPSTFAQMALLGGLLAPILLALGGLTGGVGGRLGGWLAERGGHPRQPAVADG